VAGSQLPRKAKKAPRLAVGYVTDNGVGNGSQRVMVYRKAEGAIRAHLDGKKLANLQSPRAEIFPVPGVD